VKHGLRFNFNKVEDAIRFRLISTEEVLVVENKKGEIEDHDKKEGSKQDAIAANKIGKEKV
jgi:hypothetical protein